MITDRIIEQLDKNVVAWRKSWTGGVPVNYITQKPYQGINLLLLPYGGEWLSYKQAQEAGGSVRKGEKSSIIVFYKLLEKTTADNGENEKTETIPLIRYSNVFHINQCENIKTKIKPIELNDINPIDEAENVLNNYIARSGVEYKTVVNSNEAFYRPSADQIIMPDIRQFNISEEYYSTAFHEAAHSTGHKSRLDRISKDASFGSKNYSKEELVAEISSAMVLNFLGVEIPQTFENSIAYIDGWRKKLKEDNKIILTASSLAQKATNLILGMTQGSQTE
jgi:antirestriction protein ArdC